MCRHSPLARRDQLLDASGDNGSFNSLTTDKLIVRLDPYHNHLDDAWFEVNPAGVRGDQFKGDPSWDPIWDSAARTDSLGWTAEVRIPFSHLRFSPDSVQTWGLQIWRYIDALNEQDMWSFHPRDAAGGPAYYGHLNGLTIARQPRQLGRQPGGEDRREHGPHLCLRPAGGTIWRPSPLPAGTPPEVPGVISTMEIRFKARVLLLVFLVCLLVGTGCEERPARPASNILFIAVDDLNDWIGPLDGKPEVQTPNLDRLAASSVTFTNAHTASPACAPSRTAIMTGVHPARSGIMENTWFDGPQWRERKPFAASRPFPSFSGTGDTRRWVAERSTTRCRRPG